MTPMPWMAMAMVGAVNPSAEMCRNTPAALVAATTAGCATAPKDFYADPSKPKDTALCRAVMETTDPTFQRDAAAELVKRGLTAEDVRTRSRWRLQRLWALPPLPPGWRWWRRVRTVVREAGTHRAVTWTVLAVKATVLFGSMGRSM